MEVRKAGMVVSEDMVAARAEQLGITPEELIADPFKAHYGISVDELAARCAVKRGPVLRQDD